MKTTLLTAVFLAMASLAASAQAAPVNMLSESLQSSSSLQPAVLHGNDDERVLDRPASNAPVSLLAPKVTCEAQESAKTCAVRQAATQRASEIVAAEKAAPQNAPIKPFGLLIPVGLTPVAAPGPFEPQNPVPPTVPAPAPTPGQSTIPPAVTVPQAATPPIVADPGSVVRPPPTGDGDLVKKPPTTDPEMPVIQPKPNPLVTQ